MKSLPLLNPPLLDSFPTAYPQAVPSVTDGRMGILLEVAYDGTGFHGWASQRNVRTVEQTLRDAIAVLDPSVVRIRGTSRTDAGVHAQAQWVAFDTGRVLSTRAWMLALNHHLPEDVSVRSACLVPVGFTPRFACRSKRYHYQVLFDKGRDPLSRYRAWRVLWAVDPECLKREAETMVGKHDFAAFRGASDRRETTVRTIHEVSVETQGKWMSIRMKGDSFLYHMVRILVGTLVCVGAGKLEEGALYRAFTSRKREDAGLTAPPHGLTLEEVDLEFPSNMRELWPPSTHLFSSSEIALKGG
ncbi:hypothetical protein BCY86_07510 [Pajaroellobacter abortibovis]|uniref:tRNA pseudouridine synthase A n=1 Tax=Pajaroellobacter abortibovis TaxID=1882918 RepID=A0A1L6MYP5_9BACT|nr:hypothetical protein BCY86_07510 [Pajaroellobacter abortibovis]